MFERSSKQNGARRRLGMTEYFRRKKDPQKEILKVLLHPSPPLGRKSMINKVGSVLLDDEYFVNIKKELVQIILCH
jgi:hypothetical protein